MRGRPAKKARKLAQQRAGVDLECTTSNSPLPRVGRSHEPKIFAYNPLSSSATPGIRQLVAT